MYIYNSKYKNYKIIFYYEKNNIKNQTRKYFSLPVSKNKPTNVIKIDLTGQIYLKVHYGLFHTVSFGSYGSVQVRRLKIKS